jgi:hypothetical protein
MVVQLLINVCPADWRFFRHVLPHQLKQWYAQVDQVIIVNDVKNRSEDNDCLDRVIAENRAFYPKITYTTVDYDPNTVAGIAQKYFRMDHLPPCDYRGGIIYPYLYTWECSKARYFLNLNSDMMFGGGSQSWVREAIECLKSNNDIFVIKPLSGPLRQDGKLFNASYECLSKNPPTYLFKSPFTTRSFLLDKKRFEERLLPLELLKVKSLFSRFRAWRKGREPYDLLEYMIAQRMRDGKCYRADYLGHAPGMWSLHPQYHSPAYFDQLQQIIRRVESGDVPEGQSGHYDVHPSFVDLKPFWTKAKRLIFVG